MISPRSLHADKHHDGQEPQAAVRFSAHIGYLFNEVELRSRPEAAAKVGFTAIEHPNPVAVPANEMCKILARHNLAFSQLAAGLGDQSKGEKGLAALPGRELEFRESFNRALDYAVSVRSPFVHPMAGVPNGVEAKSVEDVYLRNIAYAVERTTNTSIKVLIEAISEAAVRGYAISTLEQACKVQDIFGPGNVSLLFDTFHARACEVGCGEWIRSNIHRIGHVHIADFPGRHEPGTGTIDFDEILAVLAAQQYRGAIGFEYIPSTTTAQSAAFLAGWKTRHSVTNPE